MNVLCAPVIKISIITKIVMDSMIFLTWLLPTQYKILNEKSTANMICEIVWSTAGAAH